MNGHSKMASAPAPAPSPSPTMRRRRSRRSSRRGSSSSSLASVDDIEPLPPSMQGAQPMQATTSTSSSSFSIDDVANGTPAARYVTVSAILSRAGVLYPRDSDSSDIFAALPQPRRSSKGERRPSTAVSSGNALEALGALLLHRDSKGRASSLSFQRWYPDDASSANTFMQRLRRAGEATFGLHIPASYTNETQPPAPTIAQRRAQSRQQGVPSSGRDVAFVTVGTRRNQPSFEISRPSSPRAKPRLGRSHSYGIGSAYGLEDPPEAPPTPLAMPGDWMGASRGGRGGASTSSGDEDMALLLPPPLLDDAGSDARSFEGLLGVRRAREEEEARRRLQRLAARNRPAHKVGIMTALTNFVKAAHAAEKASKAAAVARRRGGVTRPAPPPRRHTEPPQALERRRRRSLGAEDETTRYSHAMTASMDSSRSSIDANQTLETVPEDAPGLIEISSPPHGPPPVASSRRSSIALSIRDAPSAPRLLPIQVDMPETPFTPLAKSSGSSATDYISAKGGASSSPPPAPRLGPTVLSLPPSPWTPHARHVSSRDQYPLFSLALSTSSRDSLPGTPRLAPTHLSYQPSPYPSEPASLVASPKALSALVTSPEPLPAEVAIAGTMSPSSSLALEPSSPTPASTKLDTAQADLSSRRSFLLWWLLGDLGLGNQHKLTTSSPTAPPLTLALGFLTFCLAHLVEVLYEVAETASIAFWFVRWIFLNLTGQTVLSRCILEAYSLIQAEWTLVAQEDHEEKGQRGRGLTRIQVLRGFIELVCLHAVTREQWLREGAGLRLTQGWEKDAGDGSGDDDAEDQGSDDDEEMDLVVTRRDEDILEFTRTPRIRPQDAKQTGGDYFDLATNGKHSPPSTAQRSFVRTLKWASRLAIGAYGLHVHIVDLPPTFTPSGERFNRQTFAHLSRLSDPEDVLHADIQHLGVVEDGAQEDGEGPSTSTTPPYQPTFYVARDHVRKTIVVAVRGTQSFSDIIADLDMRTEQFPIDGDGEEEEDVAAKGELTCHAGVLRAAQGLLQPGSSLLSTVSSALSDHPEFGLAFVGHSLGAAIASALAMLLGRFDSTSRKWTIGPGHSDLPAGRKLMAISFAPPATFSAALSRWASLGGANPLVLSIVLGADIIPRAGHGQARELRRVLGALARVRRRHGGRDGEEDDDARVHIFRSWWKWSRAQATTPDGSSKKRRIEDQLWRLRCDVEADLYSAIKSRNASEIHPASPWVGPHSSAPLHQLAERRQTLVDAATLRSEAALGGVLIPAGRCLYIEEEGSGNTGSRARIYDVESPLSFFSLPMFTTTMFASHLPSSYESVIEDL